MHKFTFRDDVVETIRTLHAHLRQPPPDTVKAKNLKRRARVVVNNLLRTPPVDAEALESPELLTVVLALLADALPGRRIEQDDAELAVALYLAYELVTELREQQANTAVAT